MACLDEKTNISVHKWHSHGDIFAVRQDGTSVGPSLLDKTKNIIPSKNGFRTLSLIMGSTIPSAVEARRVVSQFKKNLLHLESGREGFNKNCPANCVMGHADIRLRKDEDVVPETSFEIMFHFREIEIWARATLDELMGIVIEVKSKVKERARYGRVVDSDARFVEMPSSWTMVQKDKDKHEKNMAR